MEPEIIDWDNIESSFIQDDTYENFDAPKWVDLSASDLLLVDDEAWFCNHDCKHRKTAEDLRKPSINFKARLLGFKTISEILPYRDRNRREYSEKPRRPSFSGNFYEDNENKNPNFSAPKSNSRINKPKKPLMRANRDNPKQLNDPIEYPLKSDRKSQLKNTFSAQNLLGGRDLLNQITGLCSELKRIARKSSKKGATDKAQSGVLEELKEKALDRERVPLLVVKDGRPYIQKHNGIEKVN